MNDCRFNTAGHDGLNVMPIRLGIRRDIQLACEGCRRVIAVSGMVRVVDRRQVDVTPAVERRRSFRPAWLSRLVSRDETGRIVA